MMEENLLDKRRNGIILKKGRQYVKGGRKEDTLKQAKTYMTKQKSNDGHTSN